MCRPRCSAAIAAACGERINLQHTVAQWLQHAIPKRQPQQPRQSATVPAATIRVLSGRCTKPDARPCGSALRAAATAVTADVTTAAANQPRRQRIGTAAPTQRAGATTRVGAAVPATARTAATTRAVWRRHLGTGPRRSDAAGDDAAVGPGPIRPTRQQRHVAAGAGPAGSRWRRGRWGRSRMTTHLALLVVLFALIVIVVASVT
jgi:hypothetical protein